MMNVRPGSVLNSSTVLSTCTILFDHPPPETWSKEGRPYHYASFGGGNWHCWSSGRGVPLLVLQPSNGFSTSTRDRFSSTSSTEEPGTKSVQDSPGYMQAAYQGVADASGVPATGAEPLVVREQRALLPARGRVSANGAGPFRAQYHITILRLQLRRSC